MAGLSNIFGGGDEDDGLDSLISGDADAGAGPADGAETPADAGEDADGDLYPGDADLTYAEPLGGHDAGYSDDGGIA